MMRWAALTLVALTMIAYYATPRPARSQLTWVKSSDDEMGPLHERLQQLDQELQGRLFEWGHVAASTTGLSDDAERLRRQLEALGREIHDLDPEVAAALRFKLHMLDRLVGNLERAAERGPAGLPVLPRPDLGGIVRATAPEAVPANDDCAHATVIGEGTVAGNTSEATNDGQASCGASSSSPDVWFRYTASTTGTVAVDTIHSAYDTVLSVHTGCPGTVANQITCNDDAYGLQSAITFPVTAGTEYRIRVSGYSGAAGMFLLNVVVAGGVISGEVTDAVSSAPLTGGGVEIWDTGGCFVQSGLTNALGRYAVTPLAAGEYVVSTLGFDDYVEELYDDVPCPGGGHHGCDPTTGNIVEVTSGNTTNVDFALDLGGVISGVVTWTVTGEPIRDVRVEIFDADSFIRDAPTDASGSYSVTGLYLGNHYASAANDDFVTELYDDVPCPGSCQPTLGTPIPVALGVTTTGIDFALDRYGAISGTVTEATTGEPISNVKVRVWNDAGSQVTYDYSNDSGVFTAARLAERTYYASTSNNDGFIERLYDGIPCPGGPPSGCYPTTGTPIPVTLNATVAGIDFALDRFGAISGTVSGGANGDPLAGIDIGIWAADGSCVPGHLPGNYITDLTGFYKIADLVPGSYYLITRNPSGLLDELYDDIPCPGGWFDGCEPTTGTPVTVTSDTTTRHVNFVLEFPLPGISGTVTEEISGMPLTSVYVDAWNVDGYLAGSTVTDAAGEYRLSLGAGTYFVSTDNGLGLDDEVYDDLLCSGGSAYFGWCDPMQGFPILLSDSLVPGIDFALADFEIFSDGFEAGDLSAWSSSAAGAARRNQQ